MTQRGHQGQFNIRINDQWRICFVWRDNEAWGVDSKAASYRQVRCTFVCVLW